jgi:hypothetical protein
VLCSVQRVVSSIVMPMWRHQRSSIALLAVCRRLPRPGAAPAVEAVRAEFRVRLDAVL